MMVVSMLLMSAILLVLCVLMVQVVASMVSFRKRLETAEKNVRLSMAGKVLPVELEPPAIGRGLPTAAPDPHKAFFEDLDKRTEQFLNDK